MRFVQTRLTPRDGGLHPVEERVAAAESLSRELLHNVSLLDDETAITLFRLTGDPDRARDIAATADAVLDYQVSEGTNSCTLYAHFVPTQEIIDLLRLFREHELILNMPIEYTEDGSLRARIVGNEAVIRDVIPLVPDGISMHLEELGDYQPQEERLFDKLTRRQQETLRVALDAGYYKVPREATLVEVADQLGRSDATVGEHLRKIEAQLMAAIVP